MTYSIASSAALIWVEYSAFMRSIVFTFAAVVHHDRQGVFGGAVHNGIVCLCPRSVTGVKSVSCGNRREAVFPEIAPITGGHVAILDFALNIPPVLTGAIQVVQLLRP